MKRIIDFIMMGILFIVFLPLFIIVLVLALICFIPKIENTFVFGIVARIVMWVDDCAKRFKPPYTLKKKMYFILAYLTSVTLWLIILHVIF